ncbi:MAG: hypothetical protein MZV70_10440 [Desulfobacterales bacterium]|nr:hypothetical protein [Desulfobacterales bacterium]
MRLRRPATTVVACGRSGVSRRLLAVPWTIVIPRLPEGFAMKPDRNPVRRAARVAAAYALASAAWILFSDQLVAAFTARPGRP